MVDVAIVGAGAIAQQSYLPAVRELPNADLRWVVDVNETRAERLANEFDATGYATDYHDIVAETDAAIVATPPKFHGEIAEAFLQSGVHVLTEKPVAETSHRAAELVSLSEDHDLHYGISRQFREAPACQLLQTFVNNGALGEIDSFRIQFGDTTDWNFASDYRLQRSLAGGGVLTDKGPHVLDIALWLFGDSFVVERYEDDSFGGLEANANLEVCFDPPDGITGTVELAGSRHVDNEFEIVGQDGKLVADPGSESATLTDFESGTITRLDADDGTPNTYLLRVGQQAKRFLDAIQTGERSYVPAASGVDVLELIENCYDVREQMAHPWETPGLELGGGNAGGNQAAQKTPGVEDRGGQSVSGPKNPSDEHPTRIGQTGEGS